MYTSILIYYFSPNIGMNKERRGRLEIYYDILSTIQNESTSVGIIKPTRLQYGSNLSYDKLTKYLKELNHKKMISKNEGITIMEKGREFMNEYCGVREKIKQLGLEFT